LTSSLNQAVHAKTTRSHVALRTCNSGTKSGRELFNSAKDAASLVLNFPFKIKLRVADFLWVTSQVK